MATVKPSIIATLATGAVIQDLLIFFTSLQVFNATPPTVYLFCDRQIGAAVAAIKYPGRIVQKVCLDAYTGLNRAAMEKLPGKKYSSLFFDFTMEKVALMKWVLGEAGASALFCDADICFLGPLPDIPVGKTLGLSRHMIRQRDEDRYGKYNAGFMWFSDKATIDAWEVACGTSRFFEQAALEDIALAAGDGLYEFPMNHNYGWWRMWQGTRPVEELQAEWSINRAKGGCGIVLGGGIPLCSVHTHFHERGDAVTKMFNAWVISWLTRVSTAHEPSRRFLKLSGIHKI